MITIFLLVLVSLYFFVSYVLSNIKLSKLIQSNASLQVTIKPSEQKPIEQNKARVPLHKKGRVGVIGDHSYLVDALQILTPEEKDYLKKFVKEKTLILGTFDKTALSLFDSGLITHLQEYPDYNEVYKIYDFALNYLTEHPDILEQQPDDFKKESKPSINPRQLTDEQKEELISVLKNFPKTKISMDAVALKEPMGFLKQLESIFVLSLWNVVHVGKIFNTTIIFKNETFVRGVAISASDKNLGNIIKHHLEKYGIDCSIEFFDDPASKSNAPIGIMVYERHF